MSSARLLGHMKMAASIQRGAASMRIGTVTGYDPNTGTVKVAIQPDGLETGWIPLSSPFIGQGWGLVCGPSIGDSLTVFFDSGDINSAVAGPRLFTDQDRPPTAQSGEFVLVHSSGSALKFTNDGNVTLITQNDLIANVGGDLNATVSGTLTAIAGALAATISGAASITATLLRVIGNLSVSGTTTTAGLTATAPAAGGPAVSIAGDMTATGTLRAFDAIAGTVSLKNHVTTGVTAGTQLSGGPQ